MIDIDTLNLLLTALLSTIMWLLLPLQRFSSQTRIGIGIVLFLIALRAPIFVVQYQLEPVLNCTRHASNTFVLIVESVKLVCAPVAADLRFGMETLDPLLIFVVDLGRFDHKNVRLLGAGGHIEGLKPEQRPSGYG